MWVMAHWTNQSPEQLQIATFPTKEAAEHGVYEWMIGTGIMVSPDLPEAEALAFWFEDGQYEDFMYGCVIREVK